MHGTLKLSDMSPTPNETVRVLVVAVERLTARGSPDQSVLALVRIASPSCEMVLLIHVRFECPCTAGPEPASPETLTAPISVETSMTTLTEWQPLFQAFLAATSATSLPTSSILDLHTVTPWFPFASTPTPPGPSSPAHLRMEVFAARISASSPSPLPACMTTITLPLDANDYRETASAFVGGFVLQPLGEHDRPAGFGPGLPPGFLPTLSPPPGSPAMSRTTAIVAAFEDGAVVVLAPSASAPRVCRQMPHDVHRAADITGIATRFAAAMRRPFAWTAAAHGPCTERATQCGGEEGTNNPAADQGMDIVATNRLQLGCSCEERKTCTADVLHIARMTGVRVRGPLRDAVLLVLERGAWPANGRRISSGHSDGPGEDLNSRHDGMSGPTAMKMETPKGDAASGQSVIDEAAPLQAVLLMLPDLSRYCGLLPQPFHRS